MEFDKSKVYTAINADELKVGSTVVVANDLSSLKTKVQFGSYSVTLLKIWGTSSTNRFEVITMNSSLSNRYNLCYLISEPEEKKLKWTDLKLAEEYYYKTYPVTLNIGEEERKKKVTDIFLAGLKAKTQWHTDPNDLPPMIQDERHVSESVWISVENWGTEDGYYDYNKNCWIIRCRIVNLPILGWIEIPELEV